MSVPVITIAQMREWEKATWASGQTEAEVIRRVGKAMGIRACQLTQPDDLILVLCGKGHNGDDARCAREHLEGRRVEMMDVSAPEADLPKLEDALSRKPALLIDGLFGVGLNRPLEGVWVAFIERINQAQVRVLAVDVPSGLNADTGEPQGAAVEAFITVTVGAPKQGLLQSAAGRFVGRLEVVTDAGLISCPHRGEVNWVLPEDFTGFPPHRQPGAHKGNFGHLAIVAGSIGYHGAAVLAARGAQRAQPGLITLFIHQSSYHPVAAQLQAVMVSPWDQTLKWDGEFSAILIGPGLAARDLPAETKIAVQRLWGDSRLPTVVDASALDWLPVGQMSKSGIHVLTPHPGEAARLLKTTPQDVQKNRVQALREISRRFGNCWVVLKGHQTLVGRNAGEITVNSSGNSFLAQGGSGDVLSGYIVGLLAQPALQKDVLKTLSYAVWQHGAAADRLQTKRAGWIVEDLLIELGSTTASFDLAT